MKLKIQTILVSFTLCVIIFLSENINAQKKTIDSLVQIVQLENKDTVMVSILNKLSKITLDEGNFEQSVGYAEQALELAEELDYKNGQAYALKWIGLTHFTQGNYMLALDLWKESLESFEAIHDTIGIANLIGNIGAVYQSGGSLDNALENYLRSLNLAEKINNYHRIATNLLNIGGIYGELKEFDKALEYFNKLEKYLPSLNNPQMTSYYLTSMGETYRLKKDYDNALKYFKEALQITENQMDLAYNLKMLGKIEFEKGNVEQAIDHLNASYTKAKTNNQKQDILGALFELGNIYQISDTKRALNFYSEALVLAKELKVNSDLRDIYEGMYHTYANKGDFNNAYLYQSQYLILKDSLFNIDKDDKIRRLVFNFDLQKKQDEIEVLQKEMEISDLRDKRRKIMNYASASATVLILLLAFSYYRRYRFSKKANLVIEEEKNRSQKLLLNILPKKTAIELIHKGKVEAKKFSSVSVMFTDFKDFTQHSHNLSPVELVNSVDFYYSKFDTIIEKYGLEKIKTIGDSYMCAGGLPFPTIDHADKIIQAAFEIVEFMEKSKRSKDKDISHFDIRIGINTGPVVAGVVGTIKFAYDIWGDTVNVASRMESMSVPGKINISENTCKLVKYKYDCEYRGEFEVKNKGLMKMYFVNNVKDKASIKTIEESRVNI